MIAAGSVKQSSSRSWKDQLSEKGKAMEADGARTSKRRRRTNSLDLGSLEPKPQILYPNKERADRVTSSPQTDGFRVDEGYRDPPRPKTDRKSVV